MKKNFLLFVLSFVASAALAQTPRSLVVTGTVTDSDTSSPVPFSTITIVTPEGEILTAAAADGGGKFLVEPKTDSDFVVIFSSVGYVSNFVEVSFDSGKRRYDLGVVAIEAGVEMEGVSVVGIKPLITADNEKITYSVDADPESNTSTLVDILRKVPQLSVDADDNVLLNGQSGFKVLVNGKNNSMMSNNFKEVIKSMPANSVKDIQVITNPSTKYEAEGSGGIINIITSRSALQGYAGRVSGGWSSFNGYNANGYFSAQIGKFTLSANFWRGQYNYAKPSNFSTQEMENYVIENQRYSVFRSENDYSHMSQNVSFEASYEIDTLNLITVGMWAYTGKTDGNYRSYSNYFNSQMVETDRLTAIGDFENRYNYISGNVDYQKTFRKPDQLLTVSYNFEYNPKKTVLDLMTDTLSTSRKYLQHSKNNAYGSEHTVQIDYTDPLSEKHNIEAGVKYIARLNDSKTDNLLWDDPVWVDDYVNPANDLDYSQHIFGAYGGYKFTHNKLSLNGGMRIEGTWSSGTGRGVAGAIDFTNNQFNVIPYLNFGYGFKPSTNANISYTQRLRRPGIWHLNPYVDNNGIYISFGNPDLKTVINHTVAFNIRHFSTSWNFNGSLYSSFAKDDIMEIFRIRQSDGVIEETYINTGKKRNAGASMWTSYRFGSRFSIYASAYGNYTTVRSDELGLSNDGFNYGGNAGVTVSLWKNASFNANGGFYSGSIELQSKSAHYYHTGFSLTQKLIKDKLDITVSAQDPFTKYRRFTLKHTDPTFDSSLKNTQYARRFAVTVGYRFGKMDVSVKKAQRGISNDDKLEGGSAGGGQ